MVFNPSGDRNTGKEYILCNPRIISSGNKTELDEEGCLSFPDITSSSDPLILGGVEVTMPSRTCPAFTSLAPHSAQFVQQFSILCMALAHVLGGEPGEGEGTQGVKQLTITLAFSELPLFRSPFLLCRQRSLMVKVKALDENGKKFQLKLDGWTARIFQHEFDHLLVPPDSHLAACMSPPPPPPPAAAATRTHTHTHTHTHMPNTSRGSSSFNTNATKGKCNRGITPGCGLSCGVVPVGQAVC